MPGIYVAKPAVVSVPDVPPGWDVDWPFCGVSGYDPDPFFPAPHPPGYEPDYSLAVFGTESIAYDGTASITGTFRDNSTYVTNEPDVIAWTATVSSSPSRSVNLRFSGDEDYASSISSVCVFGTYWGATPDIEFELTDEDAGGTIILTGKSAISGSYVGATLAIEVGVAIAKVVVTFTMSVIDQAEALWYAAISITEGDDTPNLYSYTDIMGTRGDRTSFYVAGKDSDSILSEVTVGPYTDYTGSGFTHVDGETWNESGSITLTIREDGNYRIALLPRTEDYNDSTIVANVKFYDSDNNLIIEYDATATVSVLHTTYWLVFNTGTSEITETEVE